VAHDLSATSRSAVSPLLAVSSDAAVDFSEDVVAAAEVAVSAADAAVDKSTINAVAPAVFASENRAVNKSVNDVPSLGSDVLCTSDHRSSELSRNHQLFRARHHHARHRALHHAHDLARLDSLQSHISTPK